ncbi:hypothetical protein Tco_1562786 [Tanacetum coccineum]
MPLPPPPSPHYRGVIGNQSQGRPGCRNHKEVGTGGTVGRVDGVEDRVSNDERVDDLNGQGNDQGLGANGGVEGVNGNIDRANGGAPNFSTIIAQQLQNLLPTMLAQVSNRGNVGNQNGNVVNENVQENVGNVLVNGNRVGCSYKEFLACNPKEYDGKGGVVVLTRWIEKMESVHDMSGCSISQKVKYTAGSFVYLSRIEKRHEARRIIAQNQVASNTGVRVVETKGTRLGCRAVSSWSMRISPGSEPLLRTTQGTPRQGFHSTKLIALGSAGIRFLREKDGSFMMCIDYRELNMLTVKNRYPLLRIDDLFDLLQGS